MAPKKKIAPKKKVVPKARGEKDPESGKDKEPSTPRAKMAMRRGRQQRIRMEVAQAADPWYHHKTGKKDPTPRGKRIKSAYEFIQEEWAPTKLHPDHKPDRREREQSRFWRDVLKAMEKESPAVQRMVAREKKRKEQEKSEEKFYKEINRTRVTGGPAGKPRQNPVKKKGK
jgi:hypothetical protein